MDITTLDHGDCQTAESTADLGTHGLRPLVQSAELEPPRSEKSESVAVFDKDTKPWKVDREGTNM